MDEKLEKLLDKFKESSREQQIQLDLYKHLNDVFTREDVIKGCLEIKESSLLYKVIEIMESNPMGADQNFEYGWTVNMSSDKCWEKREDNWRFFEILKGHVSALEYDIFWNNYEILYHFYKFRQLNHLMLHIYGAFPDLEDLKLQSVNSLSVNFNGEYDSTLEKIIRLFPYLTLISVSNGRDIKDWESLFNLKKLEHVILLRTPMGGEIKKELAEKGIKVS